MPLALPFPLAPRFACTLLLLALSIAGNAMRGGEPLLRPHDIVAFVGGEEMVAATESGELELRLLRAFPNHDLKFRGLAWEGDTVFQQPRDLNYPTLEQQLDENGVTVVIAHFGQMESLAGHARLPEFVAAYQKLVQRLRGEGKRRVVLQPPTPVSATFPRTPAFAALPAYTAAVGSLADTPDVVALLPAGATTLAAEDYRDGIHLNARGHAAWAARLAGLLSGIERDVSRPEATRLADLVRAKNKLWFNYVRPQNWAFLNGDRTSQPSSRDHVDPEKRWFPAEMKQWLPLLAAKEQEISALCRQLKKADQ